MRQLPDEARAITIQQLQTIAGVAKGLTRTSDSLLVLDDSPEAHQGHEDIMRAREDPRMVQLREGILLAVRRIVDLWTEDASVSDVSIATLCVRNPRVIRIPRL